MPKRGNYKKTKHEQRHHIRCENCGLTFFSARELTRSCSASCRQALSRAARRARPS